MTFMKLKNRVMKTQVKKVNHIISRRKEETDLKVRSEFLPRANLTKKLIQVGEVLKKKMDNYPKLKNHCLNKRMITEPLILFQLKLYLLTLLNNQTLHKE